MKSNKTYKLYKFGQKDMIKANRIASREFELDNEKGFKSLHKVHKSQKAYSRKNYKIEL